MFDGIRRPYVSGQISGLSVQEYEDNFDKAVQLCVQMDMRPINPVLVAACYDENCNGDATKPNGEYLHHWICYMKYNIKDIVMEADAIVMLPNWTHSRGAKLELHIAQELNYPVLYVSRGYKNLSKGVGIGA